MAEKINWGILGAGVISRTFAKGVAGSKTGKVVAVGSTDQGRADQFGQEMNIPARYGTYEALLADPNVQALYIGTRHPQHAQWAIRAAEAKKHILCEKPLAVNHGQAMAMIEAARENGVMLMEAFMYRCHPQTLKLVELIKSKAIGDVRVIQSTFSFHAGFSADSRIYSNETAGGGILDVGCYTVSMARLIAGAAQGKDFADPTDVSGAAHLGQTGVDEWAIATLKFPGDILAQVSTGIAVNQENVVRISGSEGRILVPNPWLANRNAPDQGKIIVHRNGEKEPKEITIEATTTSFTYEADHFGNALLAGKKQAPPPAMTWDDSMGNIRTLDRWRESIRLSYDSEKPESMTLTVAGRPLKVREKHNMTYARLPQIDKPISRLVMGVDNQPNIPHAFALFDDYFERGGNVFDTAWAYGWGRCESLLGQWIKTRGVRDKIVLISKGAHPPMCDPYCVKWQLDESLERLQTDYLDVYFMHRDNLDFPVSEFVEAFNEAHKAGKIKLFGGSNWTMERIDEANAYAKQKGLVPLGALSNNFSLARMVDPVWHGCIACSDPTWRAWLAKNQMPVFPWSSQARGFFTDRSGPDKLEDKMMTRPWYSDDNFQRKERAYELAKKYNVEPISIALAYVLNQPFPTFPLIGPRALSETHTSLPGLNVKLSPQEVRWLNLEE